ncbi:hypothetical protein [Streptomyces canus]|uniref:hypothetical protein n=1 Tax=Streptomyces canus TaxID=58343 RepID=UPI002E308D04|nr:hypothetical protein [Streptomyces canus]
MRTSILVAGLTKVRPLLDVLGELQIEENRILANDLGDRRMFEPTPDLVIGVLAENNDRARASQYKAFTNEEVTLRLGLMAGRGVPALIIAPPSTQLHSPDPLITVARSPMTREALVDHVWAFTTSVELSPSSAVAVSPERKLENPGHYLTELDSLERASGSSGTRFERLIGSMLLDAGAAVVENESLSQAGDRVDIAFMPSRRSADIILMELKTGHISEKWLTAAEEQLQRYVIERQAKYGMVLYHDVNGRMLPTRQSTPLIVRMSARELIEKLAADPLPKVLDDAVATAVERM